MTIYSYERKNYNNKNKRNISTTILNLLLELNIMKKQWKPYGVDIHMKASGLKNINYGKS